MSYHLTVTYLLLYLVVRYIGLHMRRIAKHITVSALFQLKMHILPRRRLELCTRVIFL